MKRRAFMTLGAASIGVGVLHSTGAFSSVSAGRGIAVQAADDPNGLLGIDGIEDSPVEFTNNTDLSLDVTLQSAEVNFDQSSFTIEPTQTQTVEFEGMGTATISAKMVDSETVVGSISLDRSFENPLLQEIAGSVDAGGPNGKFEFSLENTGDVDITITGMSVDSTDTDATVVDDQLSANGTDVITDGLEIGGGIVSFDEDVPIAADSDPVSFEFDKFRNPVRDGRPNVNMEGATVTITVQFTGPDNETSTTEITLIDGS